MPDKTLIRLIVLATLFIVGHMLDHVIRDGLGRSLTVATVLFILLNLAIYTAIGVGLYLYSTGKVGPGFWALLGGVGLAVGGLGHFSPFTPQPPSYLLTAYESPVAGGLALAWLLGLMLVLAVVTGYAGYLYARRRRG